LSGSSARAVLIGHRAFRTIKQNLWFTAGYNVVGILLAATGWLPPTGAAAAQSMPDVAVMLNSSRLQRRKPCAGSRLVLAIYPLRSSAPQMWWRRESPNRR
jgi:Cd2+/Zn2+-exporting ATPase/Cu+-exporting ATPase